MVNYKLTYFDVPGRAEMSRLILHYSGVKFEDVRLTKETWPSVKPKTPFGQLPVLDVDGVQIAQSAAIARFLAKRNGLAGKDDFEAANIDSINDLLNDLFKEINEYFLVASGRKEGDKEKLYKEIMVPAMEKYFPLLEKKLAESGSGFFAKSGVSWVDFAVASFFWALKHIVLDKKFMEKYPKLNTHSENIRALPQLKEYLAKQKYASA